MDFLRVLLLADTHLGFERRGPDFFANFLTALQPALRGEVDVVVHGGDVFFRSRIPPSLVVQAFQPLAQVAARGVPVLVVPGNHERSHIPHPLLAVHRGVHIFDRPRTFVLPFACGPVAFGGFPYAHDVRARFPELLRETGPPARDAAVRLLCMHHAVEGARVGTPEFVFDRGPDVVRGRDLPAGFAAVLSGHIHRGQRLVRGLDGEVLPSPVFYPGSVERTSFAERFETKGFLVLWIRPGPSGGMVAGAQWNPLPAKPMPAMTLEATRPE